MEFDCWTVLLLRLREDAPLLSETARNELQDQHLSYLATLHTDGRLLAAGPVEGAEMSGVVGLCLYRVGREEARALGERDPAVRAGRLSVEVFSWSVPGGAVRFGPARFPRTMAEASGDQPSGRARAEFPNG